MKLIDKQTVLELQKGSHIAFEKIFTFYFFKVNTFINSYIKEAIEAEEIAEEIFMELWNNHENIKPDKSFDSYLFTIAKNKAINFLKKKHRIQLFFEGQYSTPLSPSPEDEYIAIEKSLLIDLMVEKMPSQRKNIYLQRQKGLTNEEIARELQTTKRNVESQISLALKQIRALTRFNFLVF